MKFILSIILLLLVNGLSYSQNVKLKQKKGKYGFVKKGKKILDYVYEEANYKTGNFYLVKQNEKWGVVTKDGVESIACNFDTLIVNSKTELIAIKENKYGLLNLDGSTILDFKFDDIDYAYPDSTSLVKLDGKWGILENGKMDYSKKRIIFKSPEQMPLFEYCEEFEEDYKKLKSCADKKMLEFIYRNISYPDEAQQKGVSGTIVVSFIITEKGEISNSKILRDIGAGCGQAGLDVINKMKKWTPAIQDGENVNSYFFLPIKFSLN